MTRNKKVSIIEMLLCSVLWSTAGVFIKRISWNPFVIAGVRSVVALIVVALYLLVIKHKQILLSKNTIVIGLCCAGTSIAFTCANKLTTAANSIVLQYIAPIFIVLLSKLFFKKKMRREDIIVSIVTMVGVGLFFFDNLTSGSILGNFVAIVSGLFFAGMYVFSGECNEDDRLSGILIGFMLTAIIGCSVIPIAGCTLDFHGVCYSLGLGVFQLGLPYVLYGLAASGCSALSCCLIGVIEPLLNPLWVYLDTGEKPSIFAFIGAVIVLSSITVWNIRHSKD